MNGKHSGVNRNTPDLADPVQVIAVIQQSVQNVNNRLQRLRDADKISDGEIHSIMLSVDYLAKIARHGAQDGIDLDA